MSVRWMSQAWDHSPYRGIRLLMHIACADYANDDGLFWPSYYALAHKVRCSEEWVRQTMLLMVEDGLLEVIERPGRRGPGSKGTYRLLAPWIDPERSNSVGPKEHLGPTLAGSGSNSGRIDTSYRESVKEPPTTPCSSVADNLIAHNGTPPDGGSPTPPKKTRKGDVTPLFDAFWAVYPRRVAKGSAREAYAKALVSLKGEGLAQEEAAERILTGATRYRDDPNRGELHFTAYPATWLNQGRWDDDPLPPRVASTPVKADPVKAALARRARGAG